MIQTIKLWFCRKQIVSYSTEIKGNRLQGYHDHGGGYYQ
jgi:hypothetical protein